MAPSPKKKEKWTESTPFSHSVGIISHRPGKLGANPPPKTEPPPIAVATDGRHHTAVAKYYGKRVHIPPGLLEKHPGSSVIESATILETSNSDLDILEIILQS